MSSSKNLTIQTFIAYFIQIPYVLEIYLYLPSHPDMMLYFQTSEFLIQMSVSANYIGVFCMSLIAGAISDITGRRPMLIFGCFILAMSTISCLKIENIYMFIFARLLQGLGSGVIAALSISIIFDMHEQSKATKITSHYFTLNSILVILSPIIGSRINVEFGWQMNFFIVSAISLISFALLATIFSETLAIKSSKLNMKELFENYYKLISHKIVRSNLLVFCLSYSSYIVFVSIIPLVYIFTYRLDSSQLELAQVLIIVTFNIGTLLNPFLTKKYGKETVKYNALQLQIFSFLLLCCSVVFGNQNFMLEIFSMSLIMLARGLSVSLLISDIMQQIPELRGSASALLSASRILFSSLIVALVGLFYDGTLLPYIIYVAICSALIISFLYKSKKYNY